MTAVIETLDLLLRKTEGNGHDIALIFPGESGDFIRGYVAGQVDAFRLALEHARDMAGRRPAPDTPDGPGPAEGEELSLDREPVNRRGSGRY